LAKTVNKSFSISKTVSYPLFKPWVTQLSPVRALCTKTGG
jgi:hypothetical protein